MVRPITNCRASMRMPRRSAVRITGSPSRRIMPPMTLAARFVKRQHAPGQHERPGRGVHREAVAVAEMPLPVGGGDAVLDQRIGGGGIGDAQQRFGEAQQRDTFRGAEAVFRRGSR